MSMTEAEMKTKWCPHSRVAVPQINNDGFVTGHTVPNRLDNGQYPFHSECIGSVCSQWRWAKVRNPDWTPLSPAMMSTGPHKHPDDYTPTHIASTTHGYCGLAGRP
jgi:hypothetical protein